MRSPRQYRWPLVALVICGALLGATDLLTYNNILLHKAKGPTAAAVLTSLRGQEANANQIPASFNQPLVQDAVDGVRQEREYIVGDDGNVDESIVSDESTVGDDDGVANDDLPVDDDQDDPAEDTSLEEGDIDENALVGDAHVVTDLAPPQDDTLVPENMDEARDSKSEGQRPSLPQPQVQVPLQPAKHVAATQADATLGGAFKPRALRYITLADNPHYDGICLTATSVFLSDGVLQVLAWNHSSRFFDGTSCGAQCEPNAHGDFRVGQQKKVHWLTHYFEHNQELDDDDLVLFTDAWDVVIQSDLRAITDRFLQQTDNQRGVIFNGEPTCGDSFAMPGASSNANQISFFHLSQGQYGDQLRAASFPVQLASTHPVRNIQGTEICNMIAAKTSINSIAEGPNWSLGSGGIVGDVQSIRAFIRRVNQVHDEQQKKYETQLSPFFFYGDQISFQLAYVRFPEINVKVDTSGDIFFVTSHFIAPGDLDKFNLETGCSKDYFLNGQPSKLAWDGTAPLILHFPGTLPLVQNAIWPTKYAPGQYKHLYTFCAPNVIEYVRSESPKKYFFDVDRQQNVLISTICSKYS
ncbi:Aste57867_8725 [Aphanomyces stellatus]|uniref:Aste57867_8725 protein n=1 Tax=Aphanomyces stellatus TaxID=120398 RepID=A0A485KL60_9STRA|nr:hypothetical protein As57867_008691 [Aphanomyces stellatus]VFT85611.1 Aste57867_8725 [Aphanomyces stellatus]